MKKEGLPPQHSTRAMRASSQEVLDGMSLYGPVILDAGVYTLTGEFVNSLTYLAAAFGAGGAFTDFLEGVHNKNHHPWANHGLQFAIQMKFTLETSYLLLAENAGQFTWASWNSNKLWAKKMSGSLPLLKEALKLHSFAHQLDRSSEWSWKAFLETSLATLNQALFWRLLAKEYDYSLPCPCFFRMGQHTNFVLATSKMVGQRYAWFARTFSWQKVRDWRIHMMMMMMMNVLKKLFQSTPSWQIWLWLLIWKSCNHGKEWLPGKALSPKVLSRSGSKLQGLISVCMPCSWALLWKSRIC